MDEEKSKIENQTPQWLKEVQNNSWSPEILISGLTITFIFIMNDPIHNFFAMLIQDYGTGSLSRILFVTFIISLNIIKIVLISHLLLRGFWTGLVGLSYVYPNGVKNEKLPKRDRHLKFSKPVELVLKVEKVCSLLFSIIFYFIITLILIVVLYTPAIIIQAVTTENSKLYIIIFFASISLIPIIINFLKNSRTKRFFETNIFNNILFTFSTNTGYVITIVFLVLSILSSVYLSIPQLEQFQYRNSSADKATKYEGLHKDCEKYNDERNSNLRVGKATVESFIVYDQIKLFVSKYKADEIVVSKAKQQPENFENISGKRIDREFNLSSIYLIHIDSLQITDIDWVSSNHPQTNQKGLTTIIDNLEIEKGFHKLSVNKVIWSFKKNDFELIAPWDEIVFFKN